MKKVGLIVVVFAFVMFAILGNKIWEKNDAGFYQVKQAFLSGELSVRFAPGVYLQWFGDIKTYKNVATIGFGREKGEGSADIDAIPVIFNDGSKADISGLVRVKLPQTIEGALKLKTEYAGGFDHFINSGVLPIVRNAVKLSANLRSAQDAYTTLAIFQQAIEDQLKNGPYLTRSDTVKITKSTGDVEEQQVTVIVKDKDGNPKRLNNRMRELGCEITEAVIDVPYFDKKVEEMISKRKDEAMKTELAKQEALRAKQDALTSEEQGKADVAKAKYEKEVQKVKAVTVAQEKYEVAKLQAKEALEVAKKIRAEGMAEAAKNKALVSAGLTPREKAEIEMKTAIGVAEKMATIKFPELMVIGGGGANGNTLDPFQAVGLKSFIDISKDMAKKK